MAEMYGPGKRHIAYICGLDDERRDDLASTRVDWLSERMTAREVAALIGVSVGTLANWRSARRGPSYYKLRPGRIFYLRRDVETWIAEARVTCYASAR